MSYRGLESLKGEHYEHLTPGMRHSNKRGALHSVPATLTSEKSELWYVKTSSSAENEEKERSKF